MSEAKHTPGPWHAVIAGGVQPVIGGPLITSAHTKSGMLPNYEANARLIAAAPELLEALRGVVRVADRSTIEFDAARAAIAKATGESA